MTLCVCPNARQMPDVGDGGDEGRFVHPTKLERA